MSGMAEVLEELWEQGNCAGLDGWIGLGRGQRAFDEEAVNIRRRDVEKAAAALTAAGFGPVKEAAAAALEEAADELARMDRIAATPVNQVTRTEEADYVAFLRCAGDTNWLRARAAAVRGEG